MRCGTIIDIKDELFTAQDEHRLVVFAGAGVSMSPPSNLPDFLTLTEKIIDRKLNRGKEDKDLQFDAVLGRARHSGVKVHERCHDLISNPDSKPTALHKAIFGLFKNHDEIRIVTQSRLRNREPIFFGFGCPFLTFLE